MKRLLTIAACLLVLASPAFAQGVDISGKWDVVISTQQGSQNAPMELKKDGDKFVGVFYTPQGNADISATVKDKAVTFLLPPFQTQNGSITITMNGTVEGDSMAGTMLAGDFTIDWSAKRTAAAAPAPAAAQAAPAEEKLDLTGTWSLEVVTPNGTGTPTLTLKQTGEKLSGQYASSYGQYTVTGTITGAEFTFSIPMGVEGNTVSIIYTGKADKATMKGTVTLGEMGEGTFSGKKK
jgi:hypothetical protein